MARETYNLTVISPMFLNGATSNQPEFRAASVRGQLRYWLRAIEGAKRESLEDVRTVETAFLGSTQMGSMVSVRTYGLDDLRVAESFMLPHRGEKKSPAKAIQPGSHFRVDSVTRPGVKIPVVYKKARGVWFLLGGLGKRSRRMFGAFDPFAPGEIKSPMQLVKRIKEELSEIVGEAAPISVPNFTTLHPAHSWVIVGCTQEYKDPQKLIVDLFNKLLRGEKYRPNERNFGYTARNERRASPLIAQMRKVGGNYLPVLTVMRSNAPGDTIKWNILNDFMKDAIALWDGVTVWGGELR